MDDAEDCCLIHFVVAGIAYCQHAGHALPVQLSMAGTGLGQHRQLADHLTEGCLSDNRPARIDPKATFTGLALRPVIRVVVSRTRQR